MILNILNDAISWVAIVAAIATLVAILKNSRGIAIVGGVLTLLSLTAGYFTGKAVNVATQAAHQKEVAALQQNITSITTSSTAETSQLQQKIQSMQDAASSSREALLTAPIQIATANITVDTPSDGSNNPPYYMAEGTANLYFVGSNGPLLELTAGEWRAEINNEGQIQYDISPTIIPLGNITTSIVGLKNANNILIGFALSTTTPILGGSVDISLNNDINLTITIPPQFPSTVNGFSFIVIPESEIAKAFSSY